jgi:hypothetical protein
MIDMLSVSITAIDMDSISIVAQALVRAASTLMSMPGRLL